MKPEEIKDFIINNISYNITLTKQPNPWKNPYEYLNIWLNYFDEVHKNISDRDLAAYVRDEYNLHIGKEMDRYEEMKPLTSHLLVLGALTAAGYSISPLVSLLPAVMLGNKLIQLLHCEKIRKQLIEVHKGVENADLESIIREAAPDVKKLLDQYKNEANIARSGSPAIS